MNKKKTIALLLRLFILSTPIMLTGCFVAADDDRDHHGPGMHDDHDHDHDHDMHDDHDYDHH